MKQFKEFGITPSTKGFIGDKIKIDRILNKKITVHEYRIEESKYQKGNGKCLHMQIQLGENKHVVFTGSAALQDVISRVPKAEFPFETTIVKDNDRFEFT